ncbi:MAG: DEAD/DEAH box helicase, partial [Candidatus Aminicenantes bacterium]|nr:DEAD/DEAH box helicase [Candidatus Aminicenantes bacterium]
AQTGTGKTAAFGLPLIEMIDPKLKSVQALILAPTRELAIQVAEEINSLRGEKKLVIVPIYGGQSIDQQLRRLKKGVHIVVGTPGRIIDHIHRKTLKLQDIDHLILDEADEMLNMGFKEELDLILENTPSGKRTLLFSATMSRDVERLALNFMHDPIEITIGEKNIGAENIKHVYYLVHEKNRYIALKRIADYNPSIYAIIFCRTRVETQEIADKLMNDGYSGDAIHGDLSQAQRDTVMQKFRMRNLQMLVATDVAARGLDVEGITHIINYNLPDDSEQYLHRSGRTGRAGKSGVSIAIINLKEKYKIRSIEKNLGKKFKREQVPSGKEICEKRLYHHIDRMEKVDVYNEEIESFLPTIYKKLEWLDREELIKRFVSIEFNYFLDYYKNTHDINVDIKSDKKRDERRETSDMCRFFINTGRKDNLTPQLLIGLVNDISRRLSIRIGKIDIMHSFSFFEADENHKDDILRGLNKMAFKGRQIRVGEAEPGKSQQNKSEKKKDKFRKKKKKKKFEKQKHN